MYTAPQKRFRPKAKADIERELQAAAAQGWPIRCVFLADGDAMTLSFRRLIAIKEHARNNIPDSAQP
jgi:hypothetical protein